MLVGFQQEEEIDRRTFLLAGALALGATGVYSAENDWVFLGERTVGWMVDHDTIVVGAGGGTYDHLLFKVRGNDIFILDMKVVYGNGLPDHIPLRLHIPQGGQSRAIDLRGGNRVIKRVEFTYERHTDGDGGARVQLWGQR